MEPSTSLPTGLVTFLFTDIEGSTRLLHSIGDDYPEALADHRRRVRAAVAAHGGVEVDTQGDAFFVAFAEPADALRAASDAQAALAEGPIRVRMGVHTGRPVVTSEGYVGVDVHKGARICSAGHGGQVIASVDTASEVAGWPLIPLGEHRLKDFGEPVALFQVGDGVFPPLRTISNTNLPRPASSLVGREREREAVAVLLHGDARLVTLTGPGGTGKTRLAIEAAGEVVPNFAAGTWWVGLATIRDPGLVLPTAAAAIGAGDDLAAHIGEREMLIVLDNFEQVVDAAPGVADLLEACPNLTVLVTSRELLRVRGEVQYAVPPLAAAEGTELFRARSGLDASEAVADLCARMDNIPLAIELAASRARVLSPEQILDRISTKLDLFVGGRDANPRQRTLRATIEWSHDLLADGERRLFARLSVFRGGCTLEAAEAVCESDLDDLQSLVDKSLVRRTDDRFWMLETILEFAAEHLRASGELDAMNDRHYDHFLAFARSLGLAGGSEGPHRLELLAPERDNMRAAMDRAEDAGDRERALRLATALEGWLTTVDPREGLARFERLLEGSADLPAELRAKALRCRGGARAMTDDQRGGLRDFEEALDIFREIGAEMSAAEVLHRRSVAVLSLGDAEGARRLALEAQEASAAAGGSALLDALNIRTLADIEFLEGNHDRALDMLRQAATRAHDIGFTWWEAGSVCTAAEHCVALGRFDDAEPLAIEALQLGASIDDAQTLAYTLGILAAVAASRHDAIRAGRYWGAVKRLEASGRPLAGWPHDRGTYAALVENDDPEFGAAALAGSRMTTEDAVRFGLGEGV